MNRSPLRSPRLSLALAATCLGLAACSSSEDPAPYEGPGCAIQEAEHPAFTTPSRDVVLCGNNYDETNIATACDVHFHVCRESEWYARYPEGVDPGGTLTSWGTPQADRCAGVWQADQPASASTWGDDVCNSPYNPWNNGKFLLSDDGSTVLEGDGGCCGWDSAFSATAETAYYAVYCCKT